MIVVTNSGPLIALARIGRLPILPALVGEVHVPGAVYREVAEAGGGLPGARELARAPWLHVHHVADSVPADFLRERLAAGEAEAVVLALELKAGLLLIDEARGRRVAEARGLEIMGTLGLLVLAKEKGLEPAVVPLLEALQDAGFHMGNQLRRQVLESAGEKPSA